MALIEKLTAIADAIRGKTGKTDGLTLEQMPGEIEGIQTGGDTSIEDALVKRTLTSYSNDRITEVGASAFSGCTSLTDVSFPNVTTVGASAFSGCTSLTDVSFPELITISGGMFEYSGIESVTDASFPKVTGIMGNYSFKQCPSLKYWQHSMKFIYQSRTFFGCGNLEKVDIHATGLTYHAFSGCLLNALILRRADAICELGSTNAIDNSAIVNGTGYVYVPSALLEEYKAATNWSNYAEQFRAIEDYPDICEVGV